MKQQALFSAKDNYKKIKVLSAAILLGGENIVQYSLYVSLLIKSGFR